MIEKLILTRKQWLAMRRHVARRHPQEACGLLAGRNDKVEMTLAVPNASRSPVRFRMEGLAQWRAFQRIEAGGMELLGIYHSHPDGPAQPSPTDVAEAVYPVVHIIWTRQEGSWQSRGFLIEGGETAEVALQVITTE